MRDRLDLFLNCGWNPDQTPPLLMRRVRTLAATAFLLIMVGIPFLIRAYEWQISVRMVTVPVALSLAIISLLGLRFSRNYCLFAHLSVVGVYVAGTGALVSGGGIGTITVGWWMLVPLLAGILVGLRGGLLWGLVVLLSCYTAFWLQHHGYVDLSDQTPAEFQASQHLIQAFGIIAAVLILMGSYMSQIGYSERVLAEKNQFLVQQIQRAEQAERETQKADQAKTQFLANMSHELKTPLNSILGFAKRLQGKAAEKLDEREAHALDLIASHGDHMLCLVDDLLEISQIEVNELGLNRSPVNVQESIYRVVSEVSPLAHQYELKIVQMVEEGLHIPCDGERLVQILGYMARHCIKYADKGEISIKAFKPDQNTGQIQMSCQSVPLADCEMSRFFDRYNHLHSRVDRDVGCSGLSLPLAADLAKMHGGRLSVQINGQQQMQFDLRLPIPEQA